VDITNSLENHELCGPKSWVRPVTLRCGIALLPDGTGLDPASSYCGHPTGRGQRAIADRVRGAVTTAARRTGK
jgi:hypothetical protein